MTVVEVTILYSRFTHRISNVERNGRAAAANGIQFQTASWATSQPHQPPAYAVPYASIAYRVVYYRGYRVPSTVSCKPVNGTYVMLSRPVKTKAMCVFRIQEKYLGSYYNTSKAMQNGVAEWNLVVYSTGCTCKLPAVGRAGSSSTPPETNSMMHRCCL